jgi:prephenate dehydrogenase
MELRTVLVVGTGLIGTSAALALRKRGVRVLLADRDPGAVRLARELGAGEEWDSAAQPSEQVDLAIVAVPPAHVATELLALQTLGAARFYTDVASVKAEPIHRAVQLGCDLGSYVASHPLAGREKSGPGAARDDLFLGRPWALCPTEEADPEAKAAVLRLIELCGANPVEVGAVDHDRAVAVVSHAPHVAASAVAARLEQPGELTQLLKRGVAGHDRIPGKHGGPASSYVAVQVVIGDRPGQLARLFQVCDEVGVNVEDVRLEHAPGLPLGIAELSVQPDAAAGLTEALRERGWQVP